VTAPHLYEVESAIIIKKKKEILLEMIRGGAREYFKQAVGRMKYEGFCKPLDGVQIV